VPNLVLSEANSKIVQTLARHSTVVLTIDLYAKFNSRPVAPTRLELMSFKDRRRRAVIGITPVEKPRKPGILAKNVTSH
jgi:hypothetical protein